MSIALYRKYRSKSLAEIVGQSHVTDILSRSLAAGRIAHAYLLTGPRGVGKTSIARILAHEINKLPYSDDTTHLDIIEIDAASNNGVEDIRDLREKAQVAPVSAAKKIYIIDEVHMLSKAAFNALLKTLEEPPEHVVFILATTDVDKLPATIISRTQKFTFRAISEKDNTRHLKHIAKAEGINIEDAALAVIAKRGDGSFRDSISLLDQLANIADKKAGITTTLVEEALGLAPQEHVKKLLTAYEAKDLKNIVTLLDESDQSGIQPTVLIGQLIQTIRGEIAEKPQLLPLLDQLLEAGKSSQPNIKLLTILAAHAIPKPKTAALISPTPEVSAPVKKLMQADAEEKSSHLVSETQKHPQPESQMTSKPELSPNAKPFQDPAKQDDEQNSASDQNATIKEKTKEKLKTSNNLDWQKLIDYTREHYVAIYSVLSKCSHAFKDDTLVLYTGNNFYKKKLDDAKYRSSLSQSLIEVGAGDLTIETIGTPPPPKDGVAAAVAAIMGGGEEVSVE